MTSPSRSTGAAVAARIGVLAAMLAGVGCASSAADHSYPETHPASAQAVAARFVPPADPFAGPLPIGEIRQMAGAAAMDHGDAGHHDMDHPMDHGAHGAAEAAPAAGVGVVHSVDSEARTVNLSHEPMPEIGWPAMTMDIAVAPGVDLGAVEAGSAVSFTLVRGADGLYMIDSIRVE